MRLGRPTFTAAGEAPHRPRQPLPSRVNRSRQRIHHGLQPDVKNSESTAGWKVQPRTPFLEGRGGPVLSEMVTQALAKRVFLRLLTDSYGLRKQLSSVAVTARFGTIGKTPKFFLFCDLVLGIGTISPMNAPLATPRTAFGFWFYLILWVVLTVGTPGQVKTADEASDQLLDKLHGHLRSDPMPRQWKSSGPGSVGTPRMPPCTTCLGQPWKELAILTDPRLPTYARCS